MRLGVGRKEPGRAAPNWGRRIKAGKGVQILRRTNPYAAGGQRRVTDNIAAAYIVRGFRKAVASTTTRQGMRIGGATPRKNNHPIDDTDGVEGRITISCEI